jgi:hypothetical protein
VNRPLFRFALMFALVFAAASFVPASNAWAQG